MNASITSVRVMIPATFPAASTTGKAFTRKSCSRTIASSSVSVSVAVTTLRAITRSTGVLFMNFSASPAVNPGTSPAGSTAARMSRSDTIPTRVPSSETTGT